MAKKVSIRKTSKPAAEVKLLTLEVIGGRYTLVADGEPTKASSTHKYYATSKKSLYMGPNTKYEDRTKGELAGTSGLDAAAADNPALAFDITERFEHLESLIDMVANKKVTSAVVTGAGGLGKSYTVIKALKAAGLKDLSELPLGFTAPEGGKYYRVIKGYSSVKGLYDALYENRKIIVVFDDCDSAFDDGDAANLLKGALDSYDKRIISWNKSRGSFGNDNIPASFQFEGGCILISNYEQTKINQAVRTRAMCVDVSMTKDQILERMGTLIKSDEFEPHITIEHKTDALNLLKEHKEVIKNLSLRTLIMAARIRKNKPEEWKRLATYMILSAA